MFEKPLTKRQKQILNFISNHIDSEGFPPTRNELSKHFGFRSPNAAESHLRALENKGVIRIGAGRSRGITLTALAGPSLALIAVIVILEIDLQGVVLACIRVDPEVEMGAACQVGWVVPPKAAEETRIAA